MIEVKCVFSKNGMCNHPNLDCGVSVDYCKNIKCKGTKETISEECPLLKKVEDFKPIKPEEIREALRREKETND